jgi:hypothetical protein
VPADGDVVIISTGHNVTLIANVSPNQLTVNSGGSLTGNYSVNLTGNFQNISASGTISIGSIYYTKNGSFNITSTGSVHLSGNFSDGSWKVDPFVVDGELTVDGLITSGNPNGDITGSGVVTASDYTFDNNTIFGQQPADGETVYGSNTWTGTTSSTWAVTTNWSVGSVPGNGDPARISNGVYAPQIIDARQVNDLIIYSGASLTINSSGQFTVNGTLTNHNGTDGLILNSTVYGTGSLIHNAVGIQGTVERYLSKRVWHYISTPIIYNVANIQFDDLNMGLTPAAPPFVNDQFYRWNEALDGWFDILNGADGQGTDPLMDEEVFNLGQGYAINYQVGDGSVTLSLSGEINASDKAFPITRNTSSSTFTGANLVGNPFASMVAINSNADAANNFLNDNAAALLDEYESVYLWNEQAGYVGDRNDYLTVNNASAAAYIQPGQGFMIIAASNTNLLFNKSQRKHGTAPFYKNSDEASRFELQVVNPEEATNTTLVAFIAGMTNGLDPSYDAGKFFGNPDLGLYTKLVDDDGSEYAIQSLPPSSEGSTVKVGLRTQITGEYTFKPHSIENFEEYASIVLEDKETGAILDFSNPTASYTFNIDNPGDFDNRFEMHFKSVVGIHDHIAQNKNIDTWVSGNTLHVVDSGVALGEIGIFNLLGQQLLQETYQNQYNTIDLNLPTGNYIVRVISEGNVVSNKIQLN